MEYSVKAGCGLFLIPEPVTCFRDASYKQIQRFHLEDSTASLVLVDSITSGRQALGEDWDLETYYSLNEVRIGKKLIAKDVLSLQDRASASPSSRIPHRPLRERLSPYSCYAMVLLYGPEVEETIKDIEEQYSHLTVYQMRKPLDCLWSFSLLGQSAKDGGIVRVAGKETETVRALLRVILRRIVVSIGIDTYQRAFA